MSQYIRFQYLSHRLQTKPKESLCICAYSQEPSFSHTGCLDEDSDQNLDIKSLWIAAHTCFKFDSLHTVRDRYQYNYNILVHYVIGTSKSK